MARVNPLMPRGSTADKPFDVIVTPENAGWNYSGLRVLDLPVGSRARFSTGDDEMLVLPLAGGCDVTCDDERVTLARAALGFFSRSHDFAYLPRVSSVTIRRPPNGGGRFALPAARARPAAAVPPTARPRRCRSSCAAPARPAARSTTSVSRSRSTPTG
jgi:5-deoxy-glucuronate isomerase